MLQVAGEGLDEQVDAGAPQADASNLLAPNLVDQQGIHMLHLDADPQVATVGPLVRLAELPVPSTCGW